MIIGVPRETHRHEHRVGLTPFAVARLVREGHSVVVEKKAGEKAHFEDADFAQAGAQIVYDPEEVYHRSDLVCRVGVLTSDDIDLLKPGSVIAGFHHLAVVPKPMVERLMELKTTLIGYEIIRDAEGDLPVLMPFSEMAGYMALQLGANYLRVDSGGRGILLGNIPGVPPPTILILGAGGVGRTAARQALACGCHAIVLDTDLGKLANLNRELMGKVVTLVGGAERLERYTAIADLVIGAVLIPGGKPPLLVTEDMVKGMKPGSVIVDVSIDQGGCVETSRPTDLEHPVFTKHGVIHYCVPNMTASIPRTASRGLASTALSFLSRIAAVGLPKALREDPGLAEGVYMYEGKMVHEVAAETLGIPHTPLEKLLKEKAS